MQSLDSIAREFHHTTSSTERRRLQAKAAVALRSLVERLAANASAEAIEDGLIAGLCALAEYDPRSDTFEDLATSMIDEALKSWAGAQ